MSRTRQTPRLGALKDVQIPAQITLAAAWTSFMFLYLYVDHLHLYKPGAIDAIRGGAVFTFDISPPLLTVFFASVAIPAVMVLLSLTLPARVNRIANLIVASLYIPYSIFNAAGETWDWVFFYGLSITIEVLILGFVLRSAWTWPRIPSVPAGLEDGGGLREQVRA